MNTPEENDKIYDGFPVSDKFITSAAIGAVTDSAILGGLLGGDILGGIAGDFLNGGSLDD